MSAPRRRTLLIGLAAAASAGAPVFAQQRKPVDPPLQIGFERLLVEAGFAAAIRRHFAAATGLNLAVTPGSSTELLAALERGELDAALTHAPAIEARLEAAGLSHDRHPVARSDFVLIGPSGRGRDVAGIAGLRDVAAALAAIARAQALFLSMPDGSGTHLAEQALWRDTGVLPQAPWYVSLPADGLPLLTVAGEAGACALVDRSSWLARPVKGHAVMVQGDPRLATTFHVQRPFRARHPAAKLFVAWLAGPRGRQVVRSVGHGLLATA